MEERKFLRYIKVDESAMWTYFCMKESVHSRGNGKGNHTEFYLAEQWPGAWECYISSADAVTQSLTWIHMAYLDLRREARQHNDRDDLREFKEYVVSEMRNVPLPRHLVAHYLKLKWDDVRDPRGKRLEMQLP